MDGQTIFLVLQVLATACAVYTLFYAITAFAAPSSFLRGWALDRPIEDPPNFSPRPHRTKIREVQAALLMVGAVYLAFHLAGGLLWWLPQRLFGAEAFQFACRGMLAFFLGIAFATKIDAVANNALSSRP
jgi:hypothetical protein